jgi:prepilin-type N-terminal cleavage/methylation domain-containing protein
VNQRGFSFIETLLSLAILSCLAMLIARQLLIHQQTSMAQSYVANAKVEYLNLKNLLEFDLSKRFYDKWYQQASTHLPQLSVSFKDHVIILAWGKLGQAECYQTVVAINGCYKKKY